MHVDPLGLIQISKISPLGSGWNTAPDSQTFLAPDWVSWCQIYLAGMANGSANVIVMGHLLQGGYKFYREHTELMESYGS
jgi:hypothetical protein